MLDVEIVGECAEMIDASLLFGKNRGVTSCSSGTLAEAVSGGVTVPIGGPEVVLKFFEALRFAEGAVQDRPQGRYGCIHAWWTRDGGSNSWFEPDPAILRNHIMMSWLLERNSMVLEAKVIERGFHCLQPAAKEADL